MQRHAADDDATVGDPDRVLAPSAETTVIPNGLHRIRLGEGLQAQVETRLVTLLRNYPLASCPAAAGNVPARAPSLLPPLDIFAAVPGRVVGHHSSSLAAASMLTSTSYF